MKLLQIVLVSISLLMINSMTASSLISSWACPEKNISKEYKKDTLFGLNVGLNIKTFNLINLQPEYNVQQYLSLTPLLEFETKSNIKNKYFFTFKYGIGKFKSEVNFGNVGYEIPFVENAYGMIIQQSGINRYSAFEFGYNVCKKRKTKVLLNLSMGAFHFKRKNIRNIFLTSSGTVITNYSADPRLRDKYDNLEYNFNVNVLHEINKRIFFNGSLGLSCLPAFSQRTPLEEPKYNIFLITNSVGLSFKF